MARVLAGWPYRMAGTNFYFTRSCWVAICSYRLPDPADEIMRNILLVVIIAFALLGITYIAALLGLWTWSKLFLINAGFLVFLTIVSDQINLRALEQTGRGMIIPYLVSTILKLVFSAIFLILLVKQNMEFAKIIVFSFLAYYAVFSTLEIIIVNRRTTLKKF